MKIFEYLIFLSAILGGISWTILSTKNGYTQANATIIARSIDITSTIDGKIENGQLIIGTKIKKNDALVTIRDTRIDRSLVTELKTKINYLQSEIKNTENERKGLKKLLKGFQDRSAAYLKWLKNDLKLQNDIKKREHFVTSKKRRMMIEEVNRIQVFVNEKLISHVELQTARSKADIISNQEKVSRAELTRSQQLLKSVVNNDIASASGDASYWQKSIDSITLRILDNQKK